MRIVGILLTPIFWVIWLFFHYVPYTLTWSKRNKKWRDSGMKVGQMCYYVDNDFMRIDVIISEIHPEGIVVTDIDGEFLVSDPSRLFID